MSSPLNASPRDSESIAFTLARRIGMVVVLALVFVLSATATIYLMFRSGDTRVPNVVGKTEAEATKAVENAGLRFKILRRSDASAPANTVIETRPGPNASVKKDSSLTVVISTGPPNASNQLQPGAGVLAYHRDGDPPRVMAR